MSLTESMVVHGPGSPRYQEQLIESAGAQIVLSIWQAEQDDAPVLVFIPGTMTHPLAYAAALDALAQRGITVVGVHPSGHGTSPRGRGPIRLADILANTHDAVTWAAGQYSGPIVLNGSSQGGIVALLAAADAHPRVQLAVPHNVLLPDLPDSLLVTRVPKELVKHYSRLRAVIRGLARLVPRFPVPFEWYLDPKRVFTNHGERLEFEADARNLRRYPLAMLADLMGFDTAPITSGAIKVPVVVLATTGDPLFSLDYVRQVVERIAAPSVRLVTLDLGMHLIYLAEPDQTAEAIAQIIAEQLSPDGIDRTSIPD